MEPIGGKPGKTACSPYCGEEPPERIGRREPGQSSPYCEEFLLPGATSPPGTIKTIGFRLPTCRTSNFPRTAGRNSTHRPQVRRDGSLPRTVEGKPKFGIAGSVINGLPRAVEGETLHSLIADAVAQGSVDEDVLDKARWAYTTADVYYLWQQGGCATAGIKVAMYTSDAMSQYINRASALVDEAIDLLS